MCIRDRSTWGFCLSMKFVNSPQQNHHQLQGGQLTTRGNDTSGWETIQHARSPGKNDWNSPPNTDRMQSPQKMQTNQWSNSAQNAQTTTQKLSNSLLEIAKAFELPDYEPPHVSTKSNDIVRGFGTTTNQGLYRTYNEDRISIVINYLRPNEVATSSTKRTGFFAVFDGHGGSSCSEFLKNNLHTLIFHSKYYPQDVPHAIEEALQHLDSAFLDYVEANPHDVTCGSCSIFALMVDDMCYVANVGDSRAILSSLDGKIVSQLSVDHKPNDPGELKRLTEAGAKVAQLEFAVDDAGKDFVKFGPYRMFPPGLSVSRAVGDIEGKDPKYGGLKNTLISTPDIFSFRLNPENDFMVLASDGLFDVVSNEEVIKLVYETASENFGKMDLHHLCGVCADNITKLALAKNSNDNVSVVMVALPNFERFFANFGAKAIAKPMRLGHHMSPKEENKRTIINQRHNSQRQLAQFERHSLKPAENTSVLVEGRRPNGSADWSSPANMYYQAEKPKATEKRTYETRQNPPSSPSWEPSAQAYTTTSYR
eukprot:TRINITY_DN2544_c0_g1_i1.p1 TRINITY_DN2544_c0_g1~~TRINITY_DN2544_c0_g1_i1.p1  ORF type:complete len:537 (+),score=106.58 TRINITY_DN2544_c0_g1_i1:68-1678(+)